MANDPVEDVDETTVEVDQADGRGFRPVTAQLSNLSLSAGEEEVDDELAKLPVKVQHRIEALRKLQEQQTTLEEAFEKERRLLELKYDKMYQPLYKQRAEIVKGDKEVEENTKEPAQQETDAEEDTTKGIPGFWLRALINNSIVEQMITENDLPALEYLQDVRYVSHEENNGFKLEFEFAPNPFFENQVLSKEYDVTEATGSGDAMLRNVIGTEIQWKPKKNLCEKVKKVKQRARGSKETRVVTRTEPCESFFRFFDSIELPSEEDEEYNDMILRQLDVDYQIGLTIYESIIPQAVFWFTGEAENEEHDSDYDPEDEEEDDEEGDEDDYEEDDDEEEEEEEDEEDGESGGASRKKGSSRKQKKHPNLQSTAASAEKPPECKNQ